jgi:uncharacterized membrane protein YhaH (DUF805 family)
MDGTSFLIDLGTELIIAILLIVPVWRIFSRAGFSGSWSLLLFVPFIGLMLIMLLLAFRAWPKLQGTGEAQL